VATRSNHIHESDGVPAFNFDRAQTDAPRWSLKKIAANLNGANIIHHFAREVAKLLELPAFAKLGAVNSVWGGQVTLHSTPFAWTVDKF
jgi:hypothetical protein